MQARIDQLDCWNLAPTIAMAKQALRVPPDDARVGTLSGGEEGERDGTQLLPCWILAQFSQPPLNLFVLCASFICLVQGNAVAWRCAGCY